MKELPEPTVALLPWGDRFEDFYDKIGVSLDMFRDQQSGTWLFNCVNALRSEGVRTVLIFGSARISNPVRFTHNQSGATVCILPVPAIHRKVRNGRARFFPRSKVLMSLTSYLSLPVRLLAKELRREQCRLIICQEYEHPRFDICVMLGRILRLPVFGMYQGANEPTIAFETPFRRMALRGCSGLIIGAQREINRVRSHYKVAMTKIGRIPNAIDLDNWTPKPRREARARVGLRADAKVVSWHGRVQIPTKGLDVLLDAWTLVCRERPTTDLLLLLIGWGRDADELRHRIEPFSNVIWIDRYVNDEELLMWYLSAADIYAKPSRNEGFPMTPIEAMACGLPVVASDAHGVIDILEGQELAGGIVVPRNDPAALAVALLRLIDDPAWSHELGARARRRVESRFSTELVGRMLRDFIGARGVFDETL
jgi:glycosyltransferase involved in cell wall biosynthesis